MNQVKNLAALEAFGDQWDEYIASGDWQDAQWYLMEQEACHEAGGNLNWNPEQGTLDCDVWHQGEWQSGSGGSCCCYTYGGGQAPCGYAQCLPDSPQFAGDC